METDSTSSPCPQDYVLGGRATHSPVIPRLVVVVAPTAEHNTSTSSVPPPLPPLTAVNGWVCPRNIEDSSGIVTADLRSHSLSIIIQSSVLPSLSLGPPAPPAEEPVWDPRQTGQERGEGPVWSSETVLVRSVPLRAALCFPNVPTVKLLVTNADRTQDAQQKNVIDELLDKKSFSIKIIQQSVFSRGGRQNICAGHNL